MNANIPSELKSISEQLARLAELAASYPSARSSPEDPCDEPSAATTAAAGEGIGTLPDEGAKDSSFPVSSATEPSAATELRGVSEPVVRRADDAPAGASQDPAEPSPQPGEASSVTGDIVAAHREEVSSLEVRKASLLAEIPKLESTIEVKRNELADICKRSFADAEQADALEEKVAGTEARLRSMQLEIEQLELRETRVAEEQAVAARARRELDERESLLAQRESDLSGREEWLRSLMPSWLSPEGVGEWAGTLKNDAHGEEDASNSARLLLATLTIYQQSRTSTDTRAVADALRDLGRRLFVWLSDKQIEPGNAVIAAQAFAEQANKECAGRCEVEVPMPGLPAVNQTMLFQPRSGVSAQTVSSVQSWCVRGGKREVIHRASVTV